MSEAMAGMPEAPPPSVPVDASVVVLFRRREGVVELFWLRRERTLRFAAGFYAYPGGRVDVADAVVPVVGAAGVEAARIAAAARELFEEAGVLLARMEGEGDEVAPRWSLSRAAPRGFVPLGVNGGGAERAALEARQAALRKDLDAFRTAVLEGTEPFGDGLTKRRLSIHAADFTPAGRWVTPPFTPGRRFDTYFFLAEIDATLSAQVWPGELAGGWWIRPEDALAKWEAGEALLHPPTAHALRVLKDFGSIASAADALKRPPDCVDFIAQRLEFQRGVTLFPLRTPTLLPATHTTCYLLGTRELLVVDPGAPDPAELDRLVDLLAARRAEGATPVAIVLTHHHGDHVGGVRRLVERTGLPVWAHRLTAAKVPFPVQRLLEDGEVLALEGPRPMRWRVLHTPGHAPGHLCLVDEASRAAVVGDMVAGVGTIVIDPVDGDMGAYVAQLKRLKDLPVGTLFPSHGPAIPDGPEKLDEYLAHRRWREDKVVAALEQAGRATAEALVPQAYDDVQAFVWPVAMLSTQSILLKLVREGRATRDGDHFAPVKGTP